jgi:hypothetical protein
MSTEQNAGFLMKDSTARKVLIRPSQSGIHLPRLKLAKVYPWLWFFMVSSRSETRTGDDWDGAGGGVSEADETGKASRGPRGTPLQGILWIAPDRISSTLFLPLIFYSFATLLTSFLI